MPLQGYGGFPFGARRRFSEFGSFYCIVAVERRILFPDLTVAGAGAEGCECPAVEELGCEDAATEARRVHAVR